MRYYIILLILFINNTVFSMVSVEGNVNKKSIYKWQNIKYTLTFTGDGNSFKAEGLDENSISDFEIINKRIESETIDKDNSDIKTIYKIIYTLKPINKGKLKIPELEARYFELERGNNLIPNEEPLREYNIRVFGNSFLIIMIGQWVLIVLIVYLLYKFIKKQHKN